MMEKPQGINLGYLRLEKNTKTHDGSMGPKDIFTHMNG